MPVLPDTSVWIEFFRPRGDVQAKRLLAQALQDDVVGITAPVLTELLVGLTPTRSADARAIDRLRALQTIPLDWNACVLAGELGRTLVRRGRRIPTVDLMIAGAAAVHGYEIWHFGDAHFRVLAQVGGPPQRDLAPPPP